MSFKAESGNKKNTQKCFFSRWGQKKAERVDEHINTLPNDGLIGATEDIMILCKYKDLNSN